jgi:hypothetical protein
VAVKLRLLDRKPERCERTSLFVNQKVGLYAPNGKIGVEDEAVMSTLSHAFDRVSQSILPLWQPLSGMQCATRVAQVA